MKDLTIIFTILILCTSIHSQETESDSKYFTQTAYLSRGYGSTQNVAITKDGIILVANGYGGLRSYSLEGEKLERKALIFTGGYAENIVFGPDSTIYVIGPQIGINSFILEDNTFTKTGFIDDGGVAYDISFYTDSIFFFANGRSGLKAYQITDNNFTKVAENNEGSRFGYALDVEVAADSTIFLAKNEDGLWAYEYSGDSIIKKATIYNGGQPRSLSISNDGIIFLACGGNGLWAYTYDGVKFTSIAHVNDGGYATKVVASDGKVFLASGDVGLIVYSFDGKEFSKITQIDDGGSAQGMAISVDGTVILANNIDGLRVYEFDGKSLSNKAHLADTGGAHFVATGTENVIFYAQTHTTPTSGWSIDSTFLEAYTIDSHSFRKISNSEILNYNRGLGLKVGPDNKVYIMVATLFDAFYKVYNFDGSMLSETNEYLDDGDIDFGIDGTVFLSSRDSLSANIWQDTSLIAETSMHNPEGAICVGENHHIFLANDSGLYAFNHIEGNLQNVGFLELPYPPIDITTDNNGTIFLTSYNWQDPIVTIFIEAYIFEDSTFRSIAKTSVSGINIIGGKVEVDSFGNIFLSANGLLVFKFDGDSFIQTAFLDEVIPLDWTLGNNGAVYLTSLDGLYAYEYSALNTGVNDYFYFDSQQSNISSNYPNPFQSTTTISYHVPLAGLVKILVFDIYGRELDVLLNADQNIGSYHVDWHATGKQSGIYFYRLSIDGEVIETRKMLLIDQ